MTEIEPTMTIAERYAAEGVPTHPVVYSLPDGRTFSIDRPDHYPHQWPYCGRMVTVEELVAIYAYHAQPEH